MYLSYATGGQILFNATNYTRQILNARKHMGDKFLLTHAGK